MTNNTGNIEHIGLVRSINNGFLELKVDPPQACSACEVSSSCGISNDEEKIISVKADPKQYYIGETVQVVFEDKLSFQALFLVYILPLVVVLVALFITSYFTNMV